jgi:hypothetical protein
MADHYTLDIDPDGLKLAKQWIGTVSNNLHSKGATIAGTPAEIGDQWTGEAAVSITGEMSGLGALMKSPLATDLEAIATAIGTLEGHYRTAVDESLPALNSRWSAADQTYQDAVDGADASYDRGTRTEPGEPPLNRAIREEFQTIRSTAVSAAATARQTTRDAIDEDYEALRTLLRGKTRDLSTALVEHTPVDVPPSALEDYQTNGSYPLLPLDHSALLGDLGNTSQYLQDQLEAAQQEAREQAEDDVQALRDALDDGDAEAINEALAAIGDHEDDPYYPGQLIDLLGHEGVLDLYNQVEDAVSNYSIGVEEVQEDLLAFNDTIAAGVESLDDAAFAQFSADFTGQDYAARIWALIAASDSAKGRINAIAIANFGEVYNGPPTVGGPTLIPHIFHYAYNLESTSLLEQWDDRSSGSDFADVFTHLDDEQRDEVLQRLLNISTDGGTLNNDEWQVLANLYGEALQSFRDRGNNVAGTEGAEYPSSEIEDLLEYAHFPHDPLYWDAYRGHLEDVVTDPAFLSWYLEDVMEDGVSHRGLTEALRTVDADAEDLMEQIIETRVAAGDNPDAIAEMIGYMLKTEELLGAEVNLGGVLKSIVESAIGAGVKHPLTGPTLGVFNALISEINRLEQLDASWDEAMGDNAQHNLLGFALYVKIYGVPPEFDAWLERTGRGDADDPEAIIDFFQEQKADGTGLYGEINELVVLIDESRDEE